MSGYKHGGWINDRHLYGVWASMLSRCQNTNHRQYKNYGGRGITVCKEWKDFVVFREWAYSNGYVDDENKSKCTIDRIDVNGDYEPSNCRWATAKEQMNNRRVNTFLTHNGETKTLSEWADYIGINYSTFMSRYSRNWGMKRIVETPTHSYRKKAM